MLYCRYRSRFGTVASKQGLQDGGLRTMDVVRFLRARSVFARPSVRRPGNGIGLYLSAEHESGRWRVGASDSKESVEFEQAQLI